MRQPTTRHQSAVGRVSVPEHHDVALLAQDVVDADVLRVEPVVGLVDVVGIGDRGAEDDGDDVVGEARPEGAAGRGRRDEVERPPSRSLDPEAGLDALPRLRQRVELVLVEPPQDATSTATASSDEGDRFTARQSTDPSGRLLVSAIVRRRV